MAKDGNIIKFSFKNYDQQHRMMVENYVRMVEAMFDKSTNDIAQLTAKLKTDGIFAFKDYPQLYSEVQDILQKLAYSVSTCIGLADEKEWLAACKKNDAFIDAIFDTTKLSKERLEQLHDRNLDALKTFQKRKIDGMNLSQRVWKYVDQYKDQIEQGLDVGLGEGRSAAQLARDLKQNLREPDRLYRRVRNKRGNLVLSKNAKAYHPGRGVYRSSVKNAQRLTRSEINMAYRESDQLRWQSMDFIVGYEIHRSTHEPLCKCKLCERLVGKYPKWFKFKGWHPQCMCYVTPILGDDQTFNENELGDLKAALRGTPYQHKAPKNMINDVPDEFKKWVDENIENQEDWASTPYFIKDNFVDGDLSKGLIGEPEPTKLTPLQIAEQRHAARTPEYIDALTKAWENRQQQMQAAQSSFTYDIINDPNMMFIADNIKLSYKERIENLMKNMVNAYGNADPKVQNWQSIIKQFDINRPANAKAVWGRIKDYYSDDHKAMYQSIDHLNELRVADLSVVPTQWQTTLNDLIKKINAHDISKGYFGIYADMEHAYNIYKLSTTKAAIDYGLGKLSDKTPYQLFTLFQKKIPGFTIPQKEFFDRFDTFIPLVTNGKGAYYHPTFKHVKIALDKSISDRLENSKWYQDGLFYHEYGHAFDAQNNLAKDAKLLKIYNDWQKDVLKDGGAALEQAIQGVLKPRKDKFDDWWNNSKEKKVFDDRINDARAKGDFNAVIQARKDRMEAYLAYYRKELCDLEEQLGGLSDCVQAAINGRRIIQPRGHSGNYFKSKDMQLAEFLAHCSENYWKGNIYFEQLSPQLYQLMCEYIRTVK